MASSHPPLVRTRLSAMMFLEFFIWGGWGFALSGYADNLGFTGAEIGWLLAIPALGAMISPLFVGLIADRFFPAQRVLCVLHLLGGLCLLLAGLQREFPMMMLLMMLNGLFFMPSIALCNSVAFRHIPNPDRFPRIAVCGTIGWIIAVLSATALGGMTTSNFLYQSGVASVVLAFYCLTLPHTPPKGREAGGDVFGLSALKLLKDRSFLIFITCVTLISIPACGFYFTLASPMLQQRGYPAPLALTTLNQLPSEIIFMFTMPWFVAVLGLKRVLMIGMIAWAVRYLCFMSPAFPLALVGLLLHGFCYSFLYVGAYMYVDRRAPAELKASAQSLLSFLLLGVGWVLGAKGAGFMMDQFPPEIPTMPQSTAIAVVEREAEDEVKGHEVKLTVQKGEEADPYMNMIFEKATGTLADVENKLPRWDDPAAATSVFRFLDLSGVLQSFLQSEDEKAKAEEENQIALVDTLDADKDGAVSQAEIDAIAEEGVKVNGLTYERKPIVERFAQMRKILEIESDAAMPRSQWLAFQLKPDLLEQLDTDKEGDPGYGRISLTEVENFKADEVIVDDVKYPKKKLAGVFKDAHEKLGLKGDVELDRQQWLAVQSNRWATIFLIPSIICFAILAVFAAGLRDQPAEEPKEEPLREEGPGEEGTGQP